MKKILFLITLFMLVSCNEKEIISEGTLTKEKLESFIKEHNSNFVIIKENELQEIKNSLPEPMYFENLKEFEKFLIKQKEVANSSNRDHFTQIPLDDSGGGGDSNEVGQYRIKRWRGYYYHNTTFMVDSNCNGTQLETFLSGFTLGVSYESHGGTITKNYPKISYNVSGVINYSVIIDGIGTYYSEYLNYSGTYDCPGI